ncbi:MAG TPA: cytochrome C oxidase subunit IV family protein [Verrucomicrobiae bacterium]|jgi:cytochrome c oxidase subunit 4|nr:cytochrome C oxidase subunit IV family protein [Verrucomicrobiae bacterium]
MSQQAESLKTYILTFAALMGLTLLTVAAASVNFGSLNTVIALGIAGLKAGLVLWFFMHVRHSTALSRLFIAAGFFMFGILLLLTLNDYISRPWDNFPQGGAWIKPTASHFAAKMPASPE